MQIITLTSDLGSSDYYVAALKGVLLNELSDITLIDLNIHIKPFDLRQAAYQLSQAYRFFPEKTIHVVHINPGFEKARVLIAQYANHTVVTFDNGLLSLLQNGFSDKVFALKPEWTDKSDLLLTKSVALACAVASGKKSLDTFTEPFTEFRIKNLLKPTVRNNILKGSVVAIDTFGNAITDIHKDQFDAFVGGKPFKISINQLAISEISLHYKSVSEGDLLALFNSNGFLEIAINKGKAATLLGIKVDNAVLITI
ncbi:MAG: SAM-dependent chlorinase/fluorinase [Chitinophagales bacterium]|nr:SAM-dependent chlorinase/fluorinase [Chitinophagales bacterium]MDW8273776.1 SAM-dependent chlorinase/fluorinase [Chitinophagales bacterium]